jgi:N-methylhydantoinase A
LTTDLKYDVIRTEFVLGANVDRERLNRDFQELETEVRRQLQRDGVPAGGTGMTRYADCRYAGQGYELRVVVPGGKVTAMSISQIQDDFHALHRVEYGHAFPGSPVEVVNIRAVGIGSMPKLGSLPFSPGTSLDEAILAEGASYFRVDNQVRQLATLYFDRHRLPTEVGVEGPAVLFQGDSTTVVPPGWRAEPDEAGNLLLTHG